ncbi:MAG: M48 family metallopeptidase [Lachnospiraceae bacterium]|nr:M48 family metallopeptidase [Lachnospiraceae bacterium]
MNGIVWFDGKSIEYEYKKEKRKTLSVRINDDGTVTVKAPKWVTNGEIKRFVDERAEWIFKKSETARRHLEEKKKSYRNGDIHICLGKEYRLEIEKAACDRIKELPDGVIHIKTTDDSEDEVRKRLSRLWYKKLKEYALEQIELYMPLIKGYAIRNNISMKEMTGLTIRNVKSRWGSCSSRGHINLNVKLIAADTDIVDYVIVHEMCHLMYMNHSKDFWMAVEYVFADYKELRKLLRDNGWRYEI